MSRLFNGSTDYVIHGASVVTATPFTLAAWFRLTTTGDAFPCLVSLNTDGSANNRWAMGMNTSERITAFSRAASNVEAVSTTGVADANWHHACGVFASTTSRAAFLDGGGKGSNATSSAPAAPNRTLIGAINTAVNGPWPGEIAHVAIWNVALTDAEVAMLGADRLSPMFVRRANLVCYVPYLGRDAADIDIIGARAFTVTGGPVYSAEEPPLLWVPGRRQIFIGGGATSVEVNLVGAPAATGQAGSLGASGAASANQSGVSSTGSVGALAPRGAANTGQTGVSASGSAGALAVIGVARADQAGASASGFAGNLAASGAAIATNNGLSASGAAGELGAHESRAVSLEGVGGVGSPGALAASGAAFATVNSVETQGGAGVLSVQGSVALVLTGVGASGGVSELAALVGTIAGLSGVDAQGLVGALTVTGGAYVSLAGVDAMGLPGVVMAAVDNGVRVHLAGVTASGAAGLLTITGAARAPFIGVLASGEAESLDGISSVEIVVNGVQADGSASVVTITARTLAAVPGVFATGHAGVLLAETPADRNTLPDAVMVVVDPHTIRVQVQTRTVRVGKLN